VIYISENPSAWTAVAALRGEDSPFKGGGNRFGSLGDVSATAKTALPDRDIPPGLTALSLFQGGIFRLPLTDSGFSQFFLVFANILWTPFFTWSNLPARAVVHLAEAHTLFGQVFQGLLLTH
jgi:cyclophilin family peptidyl-prolyl cis-trans isomerase